VPLMRCTCHASLALASASVGAHDTPPRPREADMDANRKQRNLDDYARTHIRRRARRLVGVAGFRSSDTEDIEQELAIHLLKSLPNFDPGKAAYDTFVWRCVEVRVRELIRYRKREITGSAGGRSPRRSEKSTRTETSTWRWQRKRCMTCAPGGRRVLTSSART